MILCAAVHGIICVDKFKRQPVGAWAERTCSMRSGVVAVGWWLSCGDTEADGWCIPSAFMHARSVHVLQGMYGMYGGPGGYTWAAKCPCRGGSLRTRMWPGMLLAVATHMDGMYWVGCIGAALRAGDPCIVSINGNSNLTSSEEFVFSWPLSNLQPSPPLYRRTSQEMLDGECAVVNGTFNLTLPLSGGGPAWLHSVSYLTADRFNTLSFRLRLKGQVRTAHASGVQARPVPRMHLLAEQLCYRMGITLQLQSE